MNAVLKKYRLLFVVLWQDVKLPLVLSQTFDQAEFQATQPGELMPDSVSVLILTPFRYWLSGEKRIYEELISKRCPHIRVKFIPGISRLSFFPAGILLKLLTTIIKGNRVFHFRGESSFNLFRGIYKKKIRDFYLLDVRGYWPAEWLYTQGYETEYEIPTNLKDIHESLRVDLIDAIRNADGVVTVSKNLATLITESYNAVKFIHVVPCCVSKLTYEDKRSIIRSKLGVTDDEILLVYSGGYAKYQHLEDLVIPFFKLLCEMNNKIKVLILSHQVETIKLIMQHISSSDNRIIYMSAPQAEVGDYLSACDLGFLLRKQTLVNKVAQPVKVGEYLAAGVPVVVEGEVGGVTEKLNAYGAGLSVLLDGQSIESWRKVGADVITYANRGEVNRNAARSLAKDYFLWDSSILKQRNFYQLVTNSKNNT
jgi:glycosyltransferase involved in cell wall biosynthesis